jgi:hypothetical protein
MNGMCPLSFVVRLTTPTFVVFVACEEDCAVLDEMANDAETPLRLFICTELLIMPVGMLLNPGYDTCVELETVPMGSSGVTCVELETIPVGMLLNPGYDTCVELETVPMGSSGVTCVELETIPVGMLLNPG